MNADMKPSSVPFSTYDLFGYVYPSVAMFAGMYAVDYIVRRAFTTPAQVASAPQVTTPFHDIVSSVVASTGGIKSVPLETAIVLMGVFVAYVLGHMIAAFSSLLAERIFLANVFGWPYKRFLFGDRSDVLKPRSAFYITIYSLPIFALILYPICLFWLGNGLSVTAVPLIGWCLILVALKLILTACNFVIDKRRSPASPDGFTSPRSAKYSRIIDHVDGILNCSCYVFAAPFLVVVCGLAKAMKTRDGFDEEFKTRVKDAFEKHVGIKARENDTNVYWLTYCLVAKNAVCKPLLDNWFLMYSFARNICAALYVVLFYSVFALYINRDALALLDRKWALALMFMPFSIHLLSVIMLARYYYLYMFYYTKFLFRGFHAAYAQPTVLESRAAWEYQETPFAAEAAEIAENSEKSRTPSAPQIAPITQI